MTVKSRPVCSEIVHHRNSVDITSGLSLTRDFFGNVRDMPELDLVGHDK